MAEPQELDALKDITLLEKICEDYLGMTFTVARRKHSRGELPLRAFRLTDNRRGPIYVHNDDLHNHISRMRKRAVAKPEGAPA